MNFQILPNYFKITWRSLFRNPVYSIITISGLALGFACCFIIFLFLQNELSYDRFHEHSDRIYRVNYKALFAGDNEFARTPPPMSARLGSYFPEIATSARLYQRDATISRQGSPDVKFEESDVVFADSTLTRIFTFETLYGDIDTALRQPGAVAISDEIAVKYFGTANAVGETLIMEGDHPFHVTAVFEAYPELSHISFNLLGSYDSMYLLEIEGLAEIMADNWVGSHSLTYVLLREDAVPENVNNRFPDFIRNNVPERFHEGIIFYLMPLHDIYLHSTAFMEPGPTGSITNVYIFSIVAFLVLIVACINFVNLSTARSLKRTMEVGIRKVIGAHRKHLVIQFIGESIIISFIALLLAILLVEFLLPFVNQLVSVDLKMLEGLDGTVALSFMGITLLTGILAGIYPALYISSFQPVAILKGEGASSSKSGDLIRKFLVIGQFTVTTILICGAIIVYKQLTYMQSQSMGFQQENVIYNRLYSENVNSVFADMSPEFHSRMETFRNEVERHPDVLATSLSDNPPGYGGAYRNFVPEGFTEEDAVFAANFSVSFGFIEAFEIELIEGRTFSEEFGDDQESAFIINEYAVNQFGWESPREAIGKGMRTGSKSGQIVGVVRNFHYENLQLPMGPVVMQIDPDAASYIMIQITGERTSETLDYLEESWNEYFPERVFDYTFLDNTIAESYKSEEQTAIVIRYFAIFAVIISLFGLFGLIMFLINQKTREIGIRKVLGASVGSIVLLFSKESLRLIFIACVIAAPLGWYWLNNWLQNFAYRIQIEIWIFVVTSIFIMLLAMVILSLQVIWAATTNPVESIRHE